MTQLNSSSAPKISVLIPSRNYGHLIVEALDSVFIQDYPHLEVLVADDGSTDDTRQVLGRYGDRVKVFQTGGRGVSRARNTLLEQSTGSLIAFLDADDYWLAGKLHAQARDLLEHPEAALSITSYRVIGDPSLTEINALHDLAPQVHGRCFELMMKACYINMCTTLLRRDAVPSHGFYTDMPQAEDYAFWLEILGRHEARHVPMVGTVHRRHPAQSTNIAPWRRMIYRELARLRALEHLGDYVPAERSRELRTLALKELRTQAYECYWHGDHAEASLALKWLVDRGEAVPWRHRARALAGAVLGRWRPTRAGRTIKRVKGIV